MFVYFMKVTQESLLLSNLFVDLTWSDVPCRVLNMQQKVSPNAHRFSE